MLPQPSTNHNNTNGLPAILAAGKFKFTPSTLQFGGPVPPPPMDGGGTGGSVPFNPEEGQGGF